jgi:RNA polymerase sigma-70 factor (ECF subfamily)
MVLAPNGHPVTAWPARRGASEEAELIRRCQAGDAEAFAPIVSEHRHRLVDLAFRMLGDRDEAESVAQDAFVRAFERIGSFRGDCRIGTWLYRITVNECLMQRRRARPTASLEAHDRACPGGWSNDDTRIEAADRVGRILPLLSDPLRAVLVMREMHEMTYDEIAAALAVPVGTVRSRLAAARRRFAEAWRGRYGEE